MEIALDSSSVKARHMPRIVVHRHLPRLELIELALYAFLREHNRSSVGCPVEPQSPAWHGGRFTLSWSVIAAHGLSAVRL
jgi:hypothetical protein